MKELKDCVQSKQNVILSHPAYIELHVGPESDQGLDDHEDQP